MELTKNEAENLLDALEEWNDAVGPKELEDNEVGLNEMRYHKLANNIKKMFNSILSLPNHIPNLDCNN